ncbi:hypothetical protein M413DRAFT_116596 [Hebeloma cylindrosporum]|uniref:Uncharacterized protein n=1 Tax=Hebeloma cylindrosporum TaxID=76867 RepID=A0A0C2YJ73_HEBCY|nr:hypothetical protein M413DRAFT_116596 [Hebeloma cylindrosporum h7]
MSNSAALAAFQNKVAHLPRYEDAIPDAPQFFVENQLLLASALLQLRLSRNSPNTLRRLKTWNFPRTALHCKNKNVDEEIYSKKKFVRGIIHS